MEEAICERCKNRLEEINLGGKIIWCDGKEIEGVKLVNIQGTQGGQCPTCGLVYARSKMQGIICMLIISADRLLPQDYPTESLAS